MKASTISFLIIDKKLSREVKNLNQKRMQEHTKKPALSHNKARNYPEHFSRDSAPLVLLIL
jgi:hypothetical protein